VESMHTVDRIIYLMTTGILFLRLLNPTPEKVVYVFGRFRYQITGIRNVQCRSMNYNQLCIGIPSEFGGSVDELH